MTITHSALYHGRVYHERISPKKHRFSYRVFMLYVDLDELQDVCRLSKLCSERWWSPLRYKRLDFLKHDEPDLKKAVYSLVKQQLGMNLEGPVRVLGQWRCFGFNFNPLLTYYCFDKTGTQLQAVVAEVTNTPWLERKAYAFASAPEATQVDFEKEFTVSPFNPVNMTYKWGSSLPDDHLTISIDTYQAKNKVFFASMRLERLSFSRKNIAFSLMTFPFSTMSVVLGIYWQALKLFLKGVPFLGKDKRHVTLEKASPSKSV